MRTTSKERSLRLCAFSVFSARICHDPTIGDDESGNRSGSQTAHGFQTVSAVRRPETTARGRDSNNRVEESPGFVDDIGEAFVVSVGKIALERGGLHRVNRQDR